MKTWYTIRAAAGDPSTAEISIHDEIGYWGISAKNFISDLRALGPVQQINLSVHSPGGEVFDGIAIYNALKNHPATVTATVEGLAASMASVIVMAADTLRMPANAFLMIHNPSGLAMGDATVMRELADLLDKLRGSLISSYTAKTGKSEADIIAMLDAETWMTGTEAVAAGFADELLGDVRAAASLVGFDTRKFINMPRALNPQATSEDEETPSVPAVPAVEPAVTPPAVVPPPVEPPAADPPAAASAPAVPPAKVPLWDRITGALRGDAAILAELTAVKAERDTSAAQVTDLTAKNAALTAELAEFNEIKAKLATAEAENATAAQHAANIVAAAGFTPETETEIPAPSAATKGDLLAQFNAISDPVAASAFYQKHRAELEKKS